MPFLAGKLNYQYNDSKKYEAVHHWARTHLLLPKQCHCGSVEYVDASNKSGKYLKELSDWHWECRKHHMDGDGRSERLREQGRSRKLPDQVCKNCGVIFHKDRKQDFHIRVCYFEYKRKQEKKIVMYKRICIIDNVNFETKLKSVSTCSSRCGILLGWKNRKGRVGK